MGEAPAAHVGALGSRGPRRDGHEEHELEAMGVLALAYRGARSASLGGEDYDAGREAGLVEYDAKRHRRMGRKVLHMPSI